MLSKTVEAIDRTVTVEVTEQIVSAEVADRTRQYRTAVVEARDMKVLSNQRIGQLQTEYQIE